MQATLFFEDQSPVAYAMPASYRESRKPENVQVRRVSIFTDPQNTAQGLQVQAFSKWLERTQKGYFDRVGGDPITGKRCTEFIVLDAEEKAVSDKLNTLVLRFKIADKESMMAREKTRLNRKTVKK